MDTQEHRAPQEWSVSFILAEFEALRALRSDISSVGESRANIYLATVSAGLVGLALLSESSALAKLLPLVSGVVFAGLLLLGVITFGRALERDINIKRYAGGLNLVRRYFVQLDPELREYLMLPITDDVPRFRTLGWLPSGGQIFSLESTVAATNSIVATVATSAFTVVIAHFRLLPAAILALAVFLATWFAHYRYMRSRFASAERQTKVRFRSHNE